MSRFICKLFGHYWGESNYPGIYEVCHRCGLVRKV